MENKSNTGAMRTRDEENRDGADRERNGDESQKTDQNSKARNVMPPVVAKNQSANHPGSQNEKFTNSQNEEADDEDTARTQAGQKGEMARSGSSTTQQNKSSSNKQGTDDFSKS